MTLLFILYAAPTIPFNKFGQPEITTRSLSGLISGKDSKNSSIRSIIIESEKSFRLLFFFLRCTLDTMVL